MNAAPFDWEQVHRRLGAVRTCLDHAGRPEPARRDVIFAQRARALAEAPPSQTRAPDTWEVVAFQLSDERYGVESHYLREIVPVKEVTPLPTAPRFVLGLLNVRGQILSLVDLKPFFDLPPVALSDQSAALILRAPGMEFGLLADRLLGLELVAGAELQPPLPTLQGLRADYSRGLTPEGLVLLDAAKLLADPRLVVREEAGW